jgi:hypothetical protein
MNRHVHFRQFGVGIGFLLSVKSDLFSRIKTFLFKKDNPQHGETVLDFTVFNLTPKFNNIEIKSFRFDENKYNMLINCRRKFASQCASLMLAVMSSKTTGAEPLVALR